MVDCKHMELPGATQEEINAFYQRLIELVAQIAKDLYKHTIEHLRRINPTLDELANLCEMLIEILQAAGDQKIRQLNEVVRVIREAAVAVSAGGDEKTVTDCGFHIDEVLRLYKAQ